MRRIRQGTPADLPVLEAIVARVVARMAQDGTPIWDEVYPACMLAPDIEAGRLWVAEEDGRPVGMIALCRADTAQNAVAFTGSADEARYLVRLAVDVPMRRRGTARRLLEHGAAVAREQGARYLRLLVACDNAAAQRLYETVGFRRVAGVYDEPIPPDGTLAEYGMERIL